MCLILHSIESFATDLNGHGVKLIPVSMKLWVCTTEANTTTKWGLKIDCAWLFFLAFMSTKNCPVTVEIGENTYCSQSSKPWNASEHPGLTQSLVLAPSRNDTHHSTPSWLLQRKRNLVHMLDSQKNKVSEHVMLCAQLHLIQKG